MIPSAATPATPTATTAPGPSPRGARKLDITFNSGTVALDAQNVTLRDIFTEWQRRGGCRFVNADKLTGGPVTRQFPAGTPEVEVIDSLLRDLGTPTTGYGYMVAPPAAERAASQSSCGAVYILPSSRPTASSAMPPQVNSPVAAPLVMPGSPDDEIPPVVPFPPPMPPQPRAGAPNPNPQQEQPANTQQPQSPGFGAVAPSATAPGANRTATPPGPPQTQPQPGGGRGGNQAP